MCNPILVLPFFFRTFDVANAIVGAERNPLKTEVIHCANDLDAAPPEWKISDVRSSEVQPAASLGVAVGSQQFVPDQFLSKADVIRTMHERLQLCQDPQTVFALLRESLGVSRVNHMLRVHGHTILEEQSADGAYDEIGQRSLERLFPGLTEDSTTQATLRAGQPGIGFKGARDISAPAHLGPLIAAKARHPLYDPRLQSGRAFCLSRSWRRLSKVVETATSTYLSALGQRRQATARLYVQKAAQAADETWEPTVSELQGPRLREPDHRIP